ncbi:MAG: phosphopyruvate hydratase [Burkholderiales bacterium]|nr:MAG: phosphopyruvate hydratase [Burkholderiales bacterium]
MSASTATDTRIEHLLARRVGDSRGRPTVEVEVHLACGAMGRAIAPAGASRGTHEAVDLRDGGDLLGGWGVRRALSELEHEIAPALLGRDALSQLYIDQRLIELDGTENKARRGGNATIAASMAVAHAAAAACGLPLWRHLAAGRRTRIPLPQVQIFGGGAHAGRRVDVQDFLAMPIGAASFDEAMVMCAEVYRHAGLLMAEAGRLRGVADEGGFWPEFASNEEALAMLARAIERAGYGPHQVSIALDVAAGEFGRDGRYRLGLDAIELDSEAWVERLVGWTARFPIVSVEDPVAEDDAAGMIRFTRAVGERVQVVGDDFLVTDAARVRAAAASGACNAALLKPNQAGTLSEMQAALEAARAAGMGMVVSARSGETEDVTIAHLAVGWDAGQLKVGSFARSERMAKWNEVLRIEETLGDGARFAGCEALGCASGRRAQIAAAHRSDKG